MEMEEFPAGVPNSGQQDFGSKIREVRRSKSPMVQPNNESVSYLMGLRNSGGSNAAASAPSLKAEFQQPVADATATSSDPQYQGAEKRRGPRFKCEGSAELRQDGRDIRTWATFTDVSLHGCYVEAQATYPAGTILHMKLEANGIRVETKGNVRMNYPYLGMGIAFVDMSGESVLRLRQMLATISHGCVVMGPGMASTLPSDAPLGAVPLITDPAAAVQELIEFFESRQMLMREDFLRILRKSQTPQIKP